MTKGARIVRFPLWALAFDIASSLRDASNVALQWQGSQAFPHLFYLVLADFEIVPVFGKDLKGNRFIIMILLEFSQYLCEIDDAGTDR